MNDQAVDAVRLNGFVRHYEGMAPVRWLMCGGLVVLLALFATPTMAVQAGLQLVFDLALTVVVARAARATDASRALRAMRWRTGVLVSLMSLNICTLAVQVSRIGDATTQVEALMLAVFTLVFSALRLHMSRMAYVGTVAPPALTLMWMAFDRSGSWTAVHLIPSMALFVLAIIATTWRQQATDRSLAEASVALAERNEALGVAVEEAQAASRAKSDLLAIASHEIRTPLNAVLGFAQALRGEPLLPHQAELAQGVLEGGAQLTRLLNAVLDHAGIEAGKTILRPAPVELRGVAETVVRVWRGQAKAAGVTLTLAPPTSAEVYEVVTDAAKVEQTLVNLVSNALKATPAGGRVDIRLTAERHDEMLRVRFEVRDTGPGVAPEDRERVFKPFEQTEAGRRQGGSGLGLSICAGNLTLMDGAIGVETAPGGGALFWFEFPAPIARAGPRRPDAAWAIPGGRPLRVLAAEDNPANRHVLTTLLEESPVSLVFAEDGAQAVATWRAQPFDLVLMDANMPVMDGLSALREIRRLESPARRIPVWMLTANVFAADVASYHEGGADGVLRKPIEVRDLFAVLSDVGEAVARRAAGGSGR